MKAESQKNARKIRPFSPRLFRTPSKSCYAPQKCLKLFWVVVPTKNSIASQKIDQKSINKGPGALALILAFIAISKA